MQTLATSNCDSDIPPTAEHNCQQQAIAKKCDEGFMQGFCCKSCSPKCAKNKAVGTQPGCSSCDSDTPPTADHNCEQQAKNDKCGESFMKGFCCKSCSPNCKA
uniref:Uncharacterized protein n=1 Tax=Panagrolaimus superbus TaxID=310955 RepID=A0A914ZGI7_9BILA